MSGVVDDLLAAIAEAEKDTDVSLQSLTNASLREFGGELEFARKLARLADNAESDSVKARIMTAVAELVNKNAQHGQEGGLSRMSDEELQDEVAVFLPSMIEATARRYFGDEWGVVPIKDYLSALSESS